MNTTITLVALAIIAVSVAFIIREIMRKKAGESPVHVHGIIERIRELGDLCVMKAHVKEVVTLTTKEDWHTTAGKMLLICSFEIEFRYDIRKAQIDSIGQNGVYKLTIPPHFCKVIPDKIIYYHEIKPRPFMIFAKDFTLEQRNRMLDQAREAAEKQAVELHDSIESRVQASAEATLRAIATAFNAQHVDFIFLKADSVAKQIREGLQTLT